MFLNNVKMLNKVFLSGSDYVQGFYLYNSYLCRWHYRDLLTVPRDSSIDWNIDNARAAAEGIINVEVNATVPKAIYLSR